MNPPPPESPSTSPVRRILITNGRVIDPVSGFDQIADVAIFEGKIAEIGHSLSRLPADRVIDAEGLLVTPGLIDPHVHLREPGQTDKEDIASGTKAAVTGGFTTVCCMPNTKPAIDTPQTVRWVLVKAGQTGSCRVFPVSCATVGRQGKEIAPIGLCAQAGAVGISDDGDVVESDEMMRSVMLATRDAGLMMMQHAQDPKLTRNSVMHEGSVSEKLALTGWPRVAEESIVERDMKISARTQCPYHVQHVSSAGTIEILRQARREGLRVSGEASPHHLHLTDQACADLGTAAKMNPPVREQADIDALRAGVADGTITILATDHAPHTAEEKALPFAEAPFGIIGLESALPLYAEALVHTTAINWPKLIQLLTSNPAKLCRLDRFGLGSLAIGGPADVTVIDPELRWRQSLDELAGKSVNTPFLDRELIGRAVVTIVAGNLKVLKLQYRE